jgi:hypothetical protein
MGYPMRLLSRLMLYAEFLEWARTFAAEPFDDRRCFDLPAAAIQANALLIANPKSELRAADFMPYTDKPAEEAAEDIDAQIIARL